MAQKLQGRSGSSRISRGAGIQEERIRLKLENPVHSLWLSLRDYNSTAEFKIIFRGQNQNQWS
jgi:hypothetical protein